VQGLCSRGILQNIVGEFPASALPVLHAFLTFAIGDILKLWLEMNGEQVLRIGRRDLNEKFGSINQAA
jgi:hypothetical protein